MRAAEPVEKKSFEEKSWRGKLGDILFVSGGLGFFFGLPIFHTVKTWLNGEPFMAVMFLIPVLVSYLGLFLVLQVVR